MTAPQSDVARAAATFSSIDKMGVNQAIKDHLTRADNIRDHERLEDQRSTISPSMIPPCAPLLDHSLMRRLAVDAEHGGSVRIRPTSEAAKDEQQTEATQQHSMNDCDDETRRANHLMLVLQEGGETDQSEGEGEFEYGQRCDALARTLHVPFLIALKKKGIMAKLDQTELDSVRKRERVPAMVATSAARADTPIMVAEMAIRPGME
uniref:Uncharacterized protein n=1 Tax=Pristionchus pacificus TaxID=54126 RepID=A0A2A6C5T7_PRIPA|eukprot:PDM73467.1 hypothetical protein PRIPAC_40823 [Pristionchus pacificus]